MQTDANAESVVLSFTHGGSSVAGNSEPVFLVDFDADRETCELDSTVALSRLTLAAVNDHATTGLVPLHANPIAHPSADIIFTKLGGNGTNVISNARKEMVSKFSTAYRSVLKLAAMVGLPRIQEEAALSRTTIIGTISTYNPYRDGKEEGSVQTASGELYDPSAWTAAIQTGLRNQFGGVRYGKLYQPTYALIASGEKQLIVKINDDARNEMVSKFSTAYRSILKLAAIVGLPRIQEEAALSRTTIIGTISTYNPYRDGKEEGAPRRLQASCTIPRHGPPQSKPDYGINLAACATASSTSRPTLSLQAAKNS